MQLIVSLNGSDGAGKTTQLEMLSMQNSGFVEKIGGVENYYPFNVTNKKDWWFSKSSAEEFCDILYSSLAERNKHIKNSNKPIILIDKGLSTFDARIYATLITKGLDDTNARKLMNKFKNQYKIEPLEDLNIFLNLSDNIDKQYELMKDRGIYNDLENVDSCTYHKYQLLQSKELLNQLSNGIYSIVDASQDIESINSEIRNQIELELEKQIKNIPVSKQIIALGGLSESGKSSAGKILLSDYDIPNFKFNFINDIVKKRYGIGESADLFENDPTFIAIFVINEIIDMMNRMYYWNIVSFESLHNYKLTDKMKKILPDNFNVLFLETNQYKRITRNALELNISNNDSEKEVNKKDEIKNSRGASIIKTIADYIIYNDESIDLLRKKIYNTVKLISNKGDNLIMRNRAGGLLIKNGEIALMHRIKEKDGKIDEYYVIPGGGIEENENIEAATIREMKEEVGIDVELVDKNPKYELIEEKGSQYFMLVRKIFGDFATGKGPEFTNSEYKNRGTYSMEMLPLEKVINGEINLVPEIIKKELVADLMKIGDIYNLSSDDLRTGDKTKKIVR